MRSMIASSAASKPVATVTAVTQRERGALHRLAGDQRHVNVGALGRANQNLLDGVRTGVRVHPDPHHAQPNARRRERSHGVNSFRRGGHRRGEFAQRDASNGGDFRRVGGDRPVVNTAKRLLELEIADLQFRNLDATANDIAERRQRHTSNGEFFGQPSMRCLLERFAWLQMFADAEIPRVRPDVFARRALLQIQLAGGVEQEHVAGAVPQTAPVHFVAWHQTLRTAVVVERFEQFDDGAQVRAG